MTAKDCLQQHVDAYDKLGFPEHGIHERTILKYGQEWTGSKWTSFRGTGLRKMPMGRCFSNCLTYAAFRDDVTYCEGYGFSGFMPVHHAWLLRDGIVCDPTWRNSIVKMEETEWSYIGIEIDWQPLMKHYHDSWSGSFLTIIAENKLDVRDFISSEAVAA